MLTLSVSNIAFADGINGKTSMMCDAKDGTEYVLNAISFPQTIQVNSNYVELNKVTKGGEGFRHYMYSDKYTSQFAELAVKRKVIFLSVNDEMMPCS